MKCILGDRERGATLEMMLTKIRKHYPQSQIVTLSATVANSEEIADWLACELVESDWRPTKLVEGVYEHGDQNERRHYFQSQQLRHFICSRHCN